MSRAFTNDEIREQFLETVRNLSKYWAAQPNKTEQERCDGLAFSLLNVFDGTSGDLPAFTITATPHPADKDFHIEAGTNYFAEGSVINADCMLHELYYKASAE